MKVSLIDGHQLPAEVLAVLAGRTCYSSVVPELEELLALEDVNKELNVKNQLFRTSHHTTIQHNHYTFIIVDIAVGDITFGFHLPWLYDSDQRSGRYTRKMFDNPNFSTLRSYIEHLYPEVEKALIDEIMELLSEWFKAYLSAKPVAVTMAIKYLQDERPNLKGEELRDVAEKVGQEQARVYVPIIFPTAMVHTINLSTLVTLNKIAWSPAMREAIDQMVTCVLERDPKISYMFEEKIDREWSPEIPNMLAQVAYKPRFRLVSVNHPGTYLPTNYEDRYPVDILQYAPWLMDNGIGNVVVEKTLSVMTMGQDQRHRTISRGEPRFTSEFYVPPTLAGDEDLIAKAKDLTQRWITLAPMLPGMLAATIAPYGARVHYMASANFKALDHEQGKRLCYNAQEEIYNGNRQLREQLELRLGSGSPLLAMSEPPCHRGKCLEGKRYCKRDLSTAGTEKHFPVRRV